VHRCRRWSRGLLLRAIVTVALAGGCARSETLQDAGSSGPDASPSPPPVPPLPCPPYTEVRAQLVTGTVAFSIDGGPRQVRTLSPSDPPVSPTEGSGRCGVGRFGTIVYPSTQAQLPPEDWSTEGGGSFGVVCDLGEVTLEVNYHVFDPRAWPVGLRDNPPEGGYLLLIRLSDFGSCDGTAPAVMRVEVTSAVGGPAPYPAGVSPDYRREFDVHIESQGPTRARSVCPTATLEADLHFLQTAAGAINNPQPVCGSL
jgi:hypothetical protein